jgi:ribosome biogenesis GTPase / thiamine phosphate phosphatase
MVESDDGKYKGTQGHHQRKGMGRLRRANSKDIARVVGWEKNHENDAFLEQHAHRSRRSHGGENLLAKFNRLAEDTTRSTPLTKQQIGSVCGFTGATIIVRHASGEELSCVVRQNLKKKISGVKNPLCIGDRVHVSEQAGENVIEAVLPRHNQLARADSHNRALLHVFAANIDCLIIVAALAEPELKYGLIDRYLLLAAYNNIPAIIVLTKKDLADDQTAQRLYQRIAIPIFSVCALSGDGVAAVGDHVRGKTCVVAGQSGVGKSSLINCLFPDLAARVGAVAEAGHGRHTTTSARSYAVAGNGQLIDTPGVRECGITGIQPLDVALLYSDIAALHPHCRFDNCSHLHEPDCAVQLAVKNGTMAASRFESYRSIIREDLAQP